MRIPKAIPGQPFFYDFAAQHVVYPDNIPYQIEWADGDNYAHPGWIELKNNQLIVAEVPDIDDLIVPLYVTIRNIPGGVSGIYKIKLHVLSLKTKKSTRTTS